MSLDDAIRISASGMTAQGIRLRTISENLANAGSTAKTPGGQPYRRQTVSFHQVLDHTSGAVLVKAGTAQPDPTQFEQKYEPGHPAADANGYVLYPNVNPVIELNDLREAQRGYEADVDVVDAVKTMQSRAVDLLK